VNGSFVGAEDGNAIAGKLDELQLLMDMLDEDDEALKNENATLPLTEVVMNDTSYEVTITTKTAPKTETVATNVPAPAPSFLRNPTSEISSRNTRAPALDLDTNSFQTAKSPYEDAPSPYDDPYYTKKEKDIDDTEYVAPKDIAMEGSTDDEVIATQWKNKEWANKTPKQIVELAQSETDKMLHDKYVPLVASAICLVSIAFTLIVVQQMVENPNGAVAKICRCTVAFIRILCWPIKMMFCCCGGGCNSRAHYRRTHERLRDDDDGYTNRDLELT
jgi:hypothetical protein